MKLAMMERVLERLTDEGPQPNLWRVVIVTPGKERDQDHYKTVLDQESYEVASQLTDALNAMFNVPGPLSAVGRGVVGEVREMAENIYRELEVEGCRS